MLILSIINFHIVMFTKAKHKSYVFYSYMRNSSETQLSEAWGSLLALIREGSSLSPPAQFLLAAVLHELMIKCCPLEERKKDQKDLQDVTAKVIINFTNSIFKSF